MICLILLTLVIFIREWSGHALTAISPSKIRSSDTVVAVRILHRYAQLSKTEWSKMGFCKEKYSWNPQTDVKYFIHVTLIWVGFCTISLRCTRIKTFPILWPHYASFTVGLMPEKSLLISPDSVNMLHEILCWQAVIGKNMSLMFRKI